MAFHGKRQTSLPLGEVVVIHLNTENDGTHAGCEQVAHEQRPVFGQPAIDGKQQAADGHQQKGTHGDVVGFARAQRVYQLRQIAQHHADTGPIAHNEGDIFRKESHDNLFLVLEK